jgi:hypothetical protein
VETSSGVSGMRMVYPGIGGGHSPGLPDPDKPFDSGTFMVGMITSYAVLDGQQIPQDPCIEDLSCDWFAPLPESN